MGNAVSLSDICGNFRTPFSLTNLTDPYQLWNIEFPPTVSKGGKKQHFQASCFDKYQWLHYDCHLDAAFASFVSKQVKRKFYQPAKQRMLSQKKVLETGKKHLQMVFPLMKHHRCTRKQQWELSKHLQLLMGKLMQVWLWFIFIWTSTKLKDAYKDTLKCVLSWWIKSFGLMIAKGTFKHYNV